MLDDHPRVGGHEDHHRGGAGHGGKENFVVPCTPRTPRQKPARPVTTLGGSSPTRHYQRTPSSPPACLTTTLPANASSQ